MLAFPLSWEAAPIFVGKFLGVGCGWKRPLARQHIGALRSVGVDTETVRCVSQYKQGLLFILFPCLLFIIALPLHNDVSDTERTSLD